MLRKHYTRGGETMFISQMEDEHLRNTIEIFLREIEKCIGLLDFKVGLSRFKSALYKVDSEEIADRAEERLQKVVNKSYPYLSEALLRGMDFKDRLQEVFQRKGAEEKFLVEADEMLLEDNTNYATSRYEVIEKL